MDYSGNLPGGLVYNLLGRHRHCPRCIGLAPLRCILKEMFDMAPKLCLSNTWQLTNYLPSVWSSAKADWRKATAIATAKKSCPFIAALYQTAEKGRDPYSYICFDAGIHTRRSSYRCFFGDFPLRQALRIHR